MVSINSVKEFLVQKRWAFVGVSENKKKFGGYAYQELKTKGYELVAINPKLKTIGDDPVYPSLAAIPEAVEAVVIGVSSTKTAQIVKEAFEQGIKHVWMQKGAESQEAIAYCLEKGINCIHGECILMYAEPSGFHSFHRSIWKLIGKYPK